MAMMTPAISKLKTVCFSGILLCCASTQTFAGIIHDKVERAEAGRPVSSLQVVTHIERKYSGKGKGIGFKKTPIDGFPDCYVVRFMTHEGELNIIKINCK